MSQSLAAPMKVEEFLRWQELQDERYELVDGRPVPHRMMTGASNRHDGLVANIIGLLWSQLRGSRCRVATADTAVRTSIRSIRRPDVTVDCAPMQVDAYEAHQPTLVVEVLSPATRRIDQVAKLEEYKRLKSLRYILLVEPERVSVLLLARMEDGWSTSTWTVAEGSVDLPEIGATLPLADIYEGVPLDREA